LKVTEKEIWKLEKITHKQFAEQNNVKCTENMKQEVVRQFNRLKWYASSID